VTPTVSVVIPTYNRARLVPGAVESALAQTVREAEVIVVDDGSTDDTRRALRPYGDRIRYVYQANRGASAAQNAGIALARGEWVAVLASDDRWAPVKLARQLWAIRAAGDGDVGGCFTDCRFGGTAGPERSAFARAGFDPPAPWGLLEDAVERVLAPHPIIYVQSLIVRRALLAELGGFDEAMVVAEDTDLLLRLALRARLCYVADALVIIDRTPARPDGLIELLARGADPAFASRDHMFAKWLALPELGDPRIRRRIERSRRRLHHDWAIRKLYQREWAEAGAHLARARRLGDSYPAIVSRLVFRAGRKLCRPLAR
jgi:glycosyltransferase involved in cell wall biosynthesis